MPIFVNINGGWEEVSSPKVFSNGLWMDLTNIMVNVSGVWMSVWEASIVMPINYYIVQPTNTAETINAAIENITGASIIMFAPGTWRLNSPILINRSDISIIGTPNETKLIPGRNFVDTALIEVGGTIDAPIKNVKISGIILDGLHMENSYNGFGIRASFIGESPTTGLSGGGYDYSTGGLQSINEEGLVIEDCIIKNNSFEGIYIGNIHNSKIINNAVINSDGILLEFSRNTLMSSNLITNHINTGLWVYECDNIHMTNNQISYSGVHGVASMGMRNSSVSNNVITDNYGDGLSLLASSNLNNISNNIIADSMSDGIYIENSSYNTVTSNIIRNSGYFAIELAASYYNTLSSNNVIGNTDGIALWGDTNNLVLATVFAEQTNSNIINEGASNIILHSIE